MSKCDESQKNKETSDDNAPVQPEYKLFLKLGVMGRADDNVSVEYSPKGHAVGRNCRRCGLCRHHRRLPKTSFSVCAWNQTSEWNRNW